MRCKSFIIALQAFSVGTVISFLLIGLLPCLLMAEELLDNLAGEMVDVLNREVIKEKIPPITRQVQKDAIKVLLRGSPDDWERFLRSGTALGTNIYQGVSDLKRRQMLEKLKKSYDETYKGGTQYSTLFTKINGNPLNIKTPYVIIKPSDTYNTPGGRQLKSPVSIERIGNVGSISPVEADGNPATKEYLLQVQYQPSDAGEKIILDNDIYYKVIEKMVYGNYLVATNETTKEIESDHGISIEDGSNLELFQGGKVKGFTTNIPSPLYIYDWDNDGIDEVLVVTEWLHQGTFHFFHILRKVNASDQYIDVLGCKDLFVELQSESYRTNAQLTVSKDGIYVRPDMFDPFTNKVDKPYFIRFVKGRMNPVIQPR